jgi:hypothetical protein
LRIGLLLNDLSSRYQRMHYVADRRIAGLKLDDWEA